MAKQLLLWTVLPYGKVRDGGPQDGLWRVSAVVSPRLTPAAPDEQRLAAFSEWLDWPDTLARASFALRFGADLSPLIPLRKPDSELWSKLFDADTAVAGFQFKDMSTVNLYSFPVRNVLGFARQHYGQLAVQAGGTHPTLLPWADAHPDLKGMLTGLGTRTQEFVFGDRKIEVALPGFSRFFDDSFEKQLREFVFGPNSIYRAPARAPGVEEGDTPGIIKEVPRRALGPDWVDPTSGAPDAALMSQFRSAEEYSFYQADRFYRRGHKDPHKRYPDFKDVAPPPAVPEFDFHRIVASYADFPELLRRLGLVIDFAVEDGKAIDDGIVAGAGEGTGQCRLEVSWDGPVPGEQARPGTAWFAREERFVPRPRGQRQTAGLLRLEHSNDGWNVVEKKNDGLFDLFQVDPDGAALKTVNFTLSAQNLVARSLDPTRKHGAVTYTTGDKQAVAALRSGGIGVSEHGRAVSVVADAAAAELKNQEIAAGNGDNVVLFAEDVSRGFRVDASVVPNPVEPGEWRTLCARTGEWRLVAADEPLDDMPDDEGHVAGASTTSSGEDDDHYLHETLFRWHGWSLAASRPGKAIKAETNEDDNLQAEVPQDVTDVAENGNGIAVRFRAVKQSLPRLRFGQLYRFRARTVDLAGNSLAPDDPSLEPLEQASDAVGYWRFEPVDPPALVHRERVSEGESLERMVIRSNFDVGAADYLATADFTAASAGPQSADFAYTAENERHVVPPKSSQQQCEAHGLFDPFFGGWEDIKKAYEIAAREAGTLYDEVAGAQIELVTPTAVAEVATSAALPLAPPDAANPVGDRTAGGQYVIHREAQLATPYLPDGAVGGTAIRAMPGHAIPGVSGALDLGGGCKVVEAPNKEWVLLVPRGEEWPFCDGFRLILVEREQSVTELPCAESFPDDGQPQWEPEARTLTLFVAKGRVVRLRYASYIDPNCIGDFGIPHWTPSDAAAQFVAKSATVGCNWLMTPYRKLTLVHAVQQPLCLPELELLSIRRLPGAQYADLLCRIVRLHGPSTGKFEIEANWHEWVDDLTKPEPERVAFNGQLGEIKLAENHANQFMLASAVEAQLADPEAARGDRHELGDTRFRLIEYRARATTRFREYLPPPLYEDPEKISRLGPVAEGAGVVLPPDDDPGAPVLRSATGSTAQTLVPASAPPKDPRLLYVVPTFRWGERPPSGPHNVTRLGNGLRVWLDRPWFSSGDGELLGVIIFQEDKPFTDVPAAMQELVTQWGVDPLWDSRLPKYRTREADFAARVTSESVLLQEKPDANSVRVIGHRVHWDGDRRLWYCDIELDPGLNYMPFVRLALVRYQPNALGSARISKVVLSDFAQVLPRRRLRVSRDGQSLDISLYGPAPQAGPMQFPADSPFQDVSFTNPPFETGRNRVEVVLQEQDEGIDSDLGWHDVKVLADSVVGGPPPDFDGGIGGVLEPLPTEASRTIVGTSPGGRTVVRRAGGSVLLPSVFERRPVVIDDPRVMDPAFWTATVTLPAGTGKRRILVREFERFYSDNTAKQRVGNQTFARRIIEERLVFADVVDPASME